MTIRSDAIRWLKTRDVKGGHVVTSKRYAPDESWTKAKAWWVQVPAAPIKAGKMIHIVCEVEKGSGHFRHLEIPSQFFEDHLDAFAMIGDDKINLFLSAEDGIEFHDQRGPGRMSFARFERE